MVAAPQGIIDEATVIWVRERIREEMDFSEYISDESLLRLLEEKINVLARQRGWTSAERWWLARRLMHSFRGLDILEPLMEDGEITEIMVNGAEEVFYEKGGEIHAYPFRFESNERLEDLIQTIVSNVNRTVNELSPVVDARLPNGSRVHAVLPPVALKGPTLTIRKFPERPLAMADLLAKDALTVEAAEFLQAAVARKRNVFVSGGTGSGKTTLLNVLAQSIPLDERVITIEDSAELQLHRVPNVVPLETRMPNSEGKGEITIRQLIRASLRMRPNRIIVGEVRGAEALDMLQAMNTGHEGSLSTGHANSVEDMLSRLEMMVLSGAELPLEVIRRQIASAIHIIVHLARQPDYTRKVMEISEVIGIRGSEYAIIPLFQRMTEAQETGCGELVRCGESSWE